MANKKFYKNDTWSLKRSATILA